MEYIIFTILAVVLIGSVFRFKGFHAAGLTGAMVAFAGMAKIVAGLFYILVQQRLYNGGDAYKYFKGGKVIYQSLWENPYYYLRLVFGKNGGFVDTPIYKYAYHTECWDHLGSYAFCRFNALLHLVSGGYYSVHVLLMALLMLLAGLNFYRVLEPLRLMPDYCLYGLVFFTPTLLFWISGIYKEGMVYLGLSCCMLAVCRLADRVSLKHSLLLFIGLGLILLFRNYLLLLLVPALVLLFFTLKYPKYAFQKFLIAYLAGIVGVVVIASFLPFNIYEILAQRQWLFLAEHGGSDFGAVPLDASLQGIAAALPAGLVNATLRPFLWDASGALQIVSSVSILLVWLFVVLVIMRWKKNQTWHPVQLFLLFYALSNLALIGILVSNSGTMMRYRVIAIHFMVLLLASLVRVGRVESVKSRE